MNETGSKTKPKAILFDLDDTLIDRDPTLLNYAKRFMNDFGSSLGACRFETLADIIIEQDRKGYKPREQFIADVGEAVLWRSRVSYEELLAHWYDNYPACSVLADGAAETLERLASQGIALGLVTNGTSRMQDRKIDLLGIRPRMTAIVVSETAGVRKPDPRIFATALEEIGASAEEVWFVGDHPANDVLGAAAAGLEPIWLRGKQPWPAGVPEPERQIDRLAQVVAMVARESAEVEPRPELAALQAYMPGLPIWEAQRRYGLVGKVTKLASNENSLGPSPLAIEAASLALQEAHRYPDASAAALRRAIADHYGVTPGEVATSNGADELIKLISEAYLRPGDEAVMPTPTFTEYAYAARLMGATVVPAPLGPNFAYDVDALLAAVSPKTKLVYVCSPNNPTGTYLRKHDAERLLNAMPSGALLVLDAAYADYAEAEDHANGVELLRAGYPLLTISTFSKVYGLAGLRAGYGIGPSAVIACIDKAREPFNVNAAAQAAATAALRDAAHVDRSVALVRSGRERLYRIFAALGLRYTRSEANFVLVDAGTDASDLCERLLRQGVIVRHGALWGLPDHIRVTVGTEEELDRLGEAWRTVGR
ncbi:histidinol-phosphate transaminase [Paenibacillus sp. TRM 82003]|nr:histidinol-phosphate transaminase [Paenibacillus sp. TRM 82003]